MRRLFILVVLISGAAVLAAGPAAANQKLDVRIDTVDIPEPPADEGTFTVSGEGADLLCPAGTWQAAGARLWNFDETGFKIKAERLFTCETGEIFVLELKNTIVVGEASVGSWKLKDSMGFDPAPKAKGDIVVRSPDGES